jgi:hypothetical protein
VRSLRSGSGLPVICGAARPLFAESTAIDARLSRGLRPTFACPDFQPRAPGTGVSTRHSASPYFNAVDRHRVRPPGAATNP